MIMRASTNLYANVDTAIQASERDLQQTMNEISSGKRVSAPSDDPLAFSQDVQSLASSANIDRYTKNATSVTSQAQVADSALSTVVSALTSAISLGTEAGNSDLTSAQRAGVAQQVQGLMQTVLAAANTTLSGVSIFAGSAGVTEAFVSDPNSPGTYSYQGNSGVNQVTVGTSLQVNSNIPGDVIFQDASGNVFGSLQQLTTAIATADPADIAQATAAVTTAISHVSQIRAMYGSVVNQMDEQATSLSQDAVTLSAQQQSLTGADLATTATALAQSQVANSAILAMAAKILPQSLLNYLH